MIPLFLKAKHWQLFSAIIIIPAILQLSAMLSVTQLEVAIDYNSTTNDLSLFQIFPLVVILFARMLHGWFWSITMGLQKFIPQELKINLRKFKIFFFIPIIYISTIMFYLTATLNGVKANLIEDNLWLIAIIIPLHLLSMFGIFHSMYCAAITIKTLELKKQVNFGDFATEFLMFWFYFIGIWIIQPKVNNLYKINSSRSTI